MLAYSDAPEGWGFELVVSDDHGRHRRVVARPRSARGYDVGYFSPAWSPDGRRLLVPWPGADQWLYLRPSGEGLTAVARIAAQFAPGTGGPAFADAVSWCCSRR